MGKAFWDFIAPQAQAQQITAGPGPEFFQQQGRMQQMGLSPDAITSLQGPLGALSSTTPSARPPQQPPQPAAVDRYLPLISALGGAMESPGGMFTNYTNTRLFQQQQENQQYRQALAAETARQHWAATSAHWQSQADQANERARLGNEARIEAAHINASGRSDTAVAAAESRMEAARISAQARLEAARIAAGGKPKPPKVLFNQGVPYAVDDGKGNIYTQGDPNIPPDLKAQMDAAQAAYEKRGTTAQKPSQNAVNMYAEQLAREGKPAGYQPTREEIEAKLIQATQELAGAKTKGGAQAARFARADEQADKFIDDVQAGLVAPVTSGLPRDVQGAVPGRVKERGVNLKTLQTDWAATQAYFKGLNSQPQIAYRQALMSAEGSLPIIEDLYEQWRNIGGGTHYRPFNKAALLLARQSGGEEGRIAQTMLGQLNDLTANLAQVYAGGGAATNEKLRLAEQNLRGEFDETTFKGAVDVLKQSLGVRRHAIMGGGPVKPGATEGQIFGGGDPAANFMQDHGL